VYELWKTVSPAHAEKKLKDLIETLKEGPVVHLRNGQPCAALVGLDERVDREAFSLGRDKALRLLIDEACRRANEEGGIPFAEIKREVDKRQRGRKNRAGAREGSGRRMKLAPCARG
jgi:hypothetical protein